MWQTIKLILVTIFMLNAFNAFSQDNIKKETEKEISAEAFPPVALQLSKQLIEHADKINFLMEVDGTDTAYEIKLRYKKQKLSVEFSANGNLEDIEVQKKLKHLQPQVADAIRNTLTDKYKRHKITRCQVQYVPAPTNNDNPVELFIDKKFTNMKIRYEIEAFVKTNENKRLKLELLFNQKGDIIKKRRIYDRSDDNILY